MRIIINGRAGTGKDVIADYLVDNHEFIKLTFADGIYDIAYEYFNMEIKDRKLLQDIGEKLREIDPNVWVNYIENQVRELDDCNIVISDCRQSNEYDVMVHKYGFIPIKVCADKEIRKERITARDGRVPDMSLLEAASETGADDKHYKITIINESSLENLYDVLDSIVEKYDHL